MADMQQAHLAESVARMLIDAVLWVLAAIIPDKLILLLQLQGTPIAQQETNRQKREIFSSQCKLLARRDLIHGCLLQRTQHSAQTLPCWRIGHAHA